MTGALHVHIGENASVIQKRAVTIQKRAYSEIGFLGDLWLFILLLHTKRQCPVAHMRRGNQ